MWHGLPQRPTFEMLLNSPKGPEGLEARQVLGLSEGFKIARTDGQGFGFADRCDCPGGLR